jgi:hypothetical protein
MIKKYHIIIINNKKSEIIIKYDLHYKFTDLFTASAFMFSFMYVSFQC